MLTLANNLLRIYISTQNPTVELIELAQYILIVYAPVWFHTKLNFKCTDGARNLWLLITKSRYLSDENQKIIDPVIQRNGFFGHRENILLGMLIDKNENTRHLAVARIIKCREVARNSVRTFIISKLNFVATNWMDMIDWESCCISEPPLTRNLSIKELESLHTENADIFTLPCHTQTVERCVKVKINFNEKQLIFYLYYVCYRW